MVNSKRTHPRQDKGTAKKKSAGRGRWIIGIGVCVLLIAVGGGVAAYLATDDAEEVIVDWNDIHAQASELARSELHVEVVELFSELSADLNEIERTDVLRLFAESRLRVSMPGNNHLREAIAVFRRVLTLEPNDYDSTRRLVFLYQSMSEQDLAIEFAEKYLDHDPADAEVAKTLAAIYLEMRKTVEATKLAASVLESAPGDMEAIRIAIGARLLDDVAEEEITAWLQEIAAATAGSDSPVRLDSLMLVYARASGDDQLAKILLQKVVTDSSSNPSVTQSMFVASELQGQGQPVEAVELLSQSIGLVGDNAESDDLTADEKMLATQSLLYQRLQLGQFEQVLQLIKDHFRGTDAYDDRITAVDFMACRFSGNDELLSDLVKQLDGYETQFARIWGPLVAELAATEPDGAKLIALADTGIETFPGSAYLYFWKAYGLELVGASDQAIEGYRAATRLASGWVMPRLRLANLFEARGDYERAFIENATALRVNPGFQPAVDGMLASAIQIYVESGEIPAALGTPVLNVVDAIASSPKATEERELFLAISARLKDDRALADRHLATYLEGVGELTTQQFRTLRVVATNAELQERISALQERAFGMTTSELLSLAVDAARQGDVDTGVQFLADYAINGEKLPDFTLQLLTCQLYTSLESDRQLAAWSELAESNRTNPAVLNLVLRIPAIQQDEQARAQMVAWLKESYPDGVEWEIQQIAIDLDKDKSQKQAAQAVFRLHELIEKAPTSRTIYGLMAVAFERLEQPTKAIEALSTAVENGADRPQYRTRLTELLADQGEEALAIRNALAVTRSPVASLALRRRAIKVLADLKEFAKAANATKQDLPARLTDSDDDFATASLYTVNSVRAGNFDGLRELFGDMPRTKDRWFNLYLSLTNTEELPVTEANEWLQEAQSWPELDDAVDRQRNLAAAWRKLASRSPEDSREPHLLNALTLLERVLEQAPTDADRLLNATLHEQTGNTEEARRLYREIADGTMPDKFRAFAQNNLALMTEDLDVAAELAQQAVELGKSAEYVDTKAFVLAKQDKRNEARKVLEEGVAAYNSHVGIRIRLVEMLLDDSELDRANELLTELAQADRLSRSLTTREWQTIRSLQTRCTRMVEDAKDSSTLPVGSPASDAAADSI